MTKPRGIGSGDNVLTAVVQLAELRQDFRSLLRANNQMAAEIARLRAVADAARAVLHSSRLDNDPALAALASALAALEGPTDG